MESKNLLIVGIDPGITTAYAVLDIEGRILKLDSSKQLELNSVISGVIEFGKAVIVGTDKAKAPNLAETLATKLGARIITPQEDLKVEDKKKITGNYNFGDEHQADALASALFAHRQIKPLLDKIDYFAGQNRREDIKDKIKELVIIKKISIKGAASLLEKKDEAAKIIEKVIVEKKLSEQDFLRLHDKLRRYENEIRIIKNHNSHLLKSIANLENEAKTRPVRKTSEKPGSFADKRIGCLERAVKSKEAEYEKLKSAIRNLNKVISNINDFYILKKLDNLGMNEFNFKRRVLDIKKNDILLVDDPNIASEALIELLKGRIFLVVHKKPISKKTENLPFIFINTKNLKIEEEKYFGFAEKKHFDAEKGKIDWVTKMVEDYKKEKRQMI
jgi:predicted RNase H-like nuclease (RuvC/YqgF family)